MDDADDEADPWKRDDDSRRIDSGRDLLGEPLLALSRRRGDRPGPAPGASSRGSGDGGSVDDRGRSFGPTAWCAACGIGVGRSSSELETGRWGLLPADGSTRRWLSRTGSSDVDPDPTVVVVDVDIRGDDDDMRGLPGKLAESRLDELPEPFLPLPPNANRPLPDAVGRASAEKYESPPGRLPSSSSSDSGGGVCTTSGVSAPPVQTVIGARGP